MKRFVLGFLLCFVLCSTGCRSQSTSTGSASVVGKWQLVAVKRHKRIDMSMLGETREYKADGTLVEFDSSDYGTPGQVHTATHHGAWSLEGNVLEQSWTDQPVGPSNPNQCRLTYDGGEMIMDYGDVGERIYKRL